MCNDKYYKRVRSNIEVVDKGVGGVIVRYLTQANKVCTISNQHPSLKLVCSVYCCCKTIFHHKRLSTVILWINVNVINILYFNSIWIKLFENSWRNNVYYCIQINQTTLIIYSIQIKVIFTSMNSLYWLYKRFFF